ncbi:hypothetical protein EAE96_007532 [Botrytis aclada]|nr:hypothetical protein EAE96_007532 [Botrytis aclada]
MHITTTSLLTLLFSLSIPLSVTAIPTPAPAPASKTTKEDLSYLAELFASDSLARSFKLRADSQFPLADPSANKKVCGRAYARKDTDTAFFGKQCCCMFLHTKDGVGGKRQAERIHGGGLVGGLLEHREGGLGWRLGLGGGETRFWGEGGGAEDAMITCGLDEGTGVCEEG